MAKNSYLTEFEKNCIRVGKSKGIPNATIARALKRSPQVIGQHVKHMSAAGTLDNLPFDAFADDIAELISHRGALR